MDNLFLKINEKFPSFRSIERWECDEFGYESVSEFCNSKEFAFGIHTIFDGDYPLDIHLNLKKKLPLIILFNGALPSRDESLKLPIFSGFGVIPSAKASVVRISDPALYASKDLKLGWYADKELHSKICEIIKKIIDTYFPSKVIFFGGSGGGYACLNFSRMFNESLAVIWNPQTDILKFDKGQVCEYASSVFKINTFKECESKLPLVTYSNLYDFYKKNIQKNYVIYIQNQNDWHVRWHCIPFLKATGRSMGEFVSLCVDDKFYLYFGNFGDGHTPPPREFQKYLISSLIDSNLSVGELFVNDSLKNILSEAECLSQEQ